MFSFEFALDPFLVRLSLLKDGVCLPRVCGAGAASLRRGIADPAALPALQTTSCFSQMQGNTVFFGLISVLFFRKSLILGPTDSGGRGGDRKHSSPVVYSSVCLTFTAQNHRRVWGSLERHSSSPSFAKFKDKAKTKNKQTKKSKKKHKNKKHKKKRESSPGLCFKPLRGEVTPCAWGSLWVRRAWLFVPSIVGWHSVGRLWVWPCGQGDGHQSGCVPRPTHLRAKQGCSWPFRSMPVGLAAHICPRNRGQMTPLPGLQLFSKPLRIALFIPSRCPPKPMWQDYWTSLSGTILNPYYLGLLRGGERPLPLGSTI